MQALPGEHRGDDHVALGRARGQRKPRRLHVVDRRRRIAQERDARRRIDRVQPLRRTRIGLAAQATGRSLRAHHRARAARPHPSAGRPDRR